MPQWPTTNEPDVYVQVSARLRVPHKKKPMGMIFDEGVEQRMIRGDLLRVADLLHDWWLPLPWRLRRLSVGGEAGQVHE